MPARNAFGLRWQVLPGGRDAAEGVEIAGKLEAAGADALHIDAGSEAETYNVPWNTSAFPDGVYHLDAEMGHKGGFEILSPWVTVIVDNTPPVVDIQVPRDVILDRLCTRRTCENPECQAIYNVKSMPTKVEGICDKCGSKTIQRADETEVALLFCDIDYFKQLNDRYGHLVGDDVLRKVSRILTSSIRRGDVAARYGGDEFCVLLRGAGIDKALEAAERVRERVSELYVQPGDDGVSVSIGVAALSEHRDGKELLASADEAMYAAKEAGRNRVVRADTLQEAPLHLATLL